MLKFKNPDDRIRLLVEINRLDLLDSDSIPEEVLDEFIKKRKLQVNSIKDFSRKQDAKAAWRKNRWGYLKGIKKFHRSIEGKRHHRALGRFLATRLFEPSRSESTPLNTNEALKAVASLKTRFYIESGYYRSLTEDVDFQELKDYCLPVLMRVEQKMAEDQVKNLTQDELELLCRLEDPDELTAAVKSQIGESALEAWMSTMAQHTIHDTYWFTLGTPAFGEKHD